MGDTNRRITALRQGTHRISVLGGGDPVRHLGRLRGENGQGVVEFALVLPLFAAVVFMFISFGKALYYYIDLTHVANEGARIASVSLATMPDGSTGSTNLGSYLCSQLGTSSQELRHGSSAVDKAKVTVTYGSTQNVGDPVTVAVSTTYHWIPFFGGGSLSISGSSTMRIENPPAATGSNYGASYTCT